MLNEFFTDEFLEKARNTVRAFGPLFGVTLLGLIIYFGIYRTLQRDYELLDRISDDNPGISVVGAYAEATDLAVDAAIAAEAFATEAAQIAEAEATEAAIRATEESAAAMAAGDASASEGATFDKNELAAAFNKGGCLGCHIIPDIPGAVGVVGPDLTGLGQVAASRRDGYTAEEYIHESIIDPEAFIAPECPTGACIAGLMQPSFGAALSETELELVVEYLAQLN